MKNNLILEKLEGVQKRFNEINNQLTDPSVVNDIKKYIKLNKEYKELEPIVNAYNKYKNLIANIESAKKFLKKKKMKNLKNWQN